MARLDPELAPLEAQDAAQVIEQFPHVDHRADEPAPAYTPDEKHIQEKTEKLEKAGSLSSGTVDEVEVGDDDKLHDERGREKVLETAEDFSRALVSSDDDPNLTIQTFRMWFTGIGLAVFGAVLGMLFVGAVSRNATTEYSHSVHVAIPPSSNISLCAVPSASRLHDRSLLRGHHTRPNKSMEQWQSVLEVHESGAFQ